MNHKNACNYHHECTLSENFQPKHADEKLLFHNTLSFISSVNEWLCVSTYIRTVGVVQHKMLELKAIGFMLSCTQNTRTREKESGGHAVEQVARRVALELVGTWSTSDRAVCWVAGDGRAESPVTTGSRP